MPFHVVAAVILDEDERVLIAQRPSDKHQGGLWEFPGGKVEPDEKVRDALCRELEEELGIVPSKYEPLIKIHHDYPDKSVLLDVWKVSGFTGEEYGREDQPIKWVEKLKLKNFDFPEANRPILTALTLPPLYFVTGTFTDKSELVSKVAAALSRGVSLVQFHAPWLDEENYLECVEALVPLFAGTENQLLVQGDLLWLLDHPEIDGIHLTSLQLEQLSKDGWTSGNDKLIGASCHSGVQLVQAAKLGASFVTLSPVLESSSHPDANPLSWAQAGPMVESATVPVYFQGGLFRHDLPRARKLGAQGIAATSAWW